MPGTHVPVEEVEENCNAGRRKRKCFTGRLKLLKFVLSVNSSVRDTSNKFMDMDACMDRQTEKQERKNMFKYLTLKGIKIHLKGN